MTSRLFLAALFLLVVYGGVLLVHDRGMPTKDAPLEMNVQDLPATLGEWQGTAVTLDGEMFKAIGAQMAMDRDYRDHSGHAVKFHMAVFGKPEQAQGTRHPPMLCYGSSGWQIGEPKVVALGQNPVDGNSAELFPAERSSEKAYILYWYQIDGHAYAAGDRQRQLIQGLRGRPTFPPIVKVMLHTTAASPEQAEKTLTALAAEVFAWTRDFH